MSSPNPIGVRVRRDTTGAVSRRGFLQLPCAATVLVGLVQIVLYHDPGAR